MRMVASVPADDTAATRRRHHNADHTRSHVAPETAFLSTRDIVRRRRTNALYALIGANLLTLFLAFTTGSGAMIWAFAIAVAALVGYCWMLVQIRTQEQLRRHRQRYFSAA
jgi:Flp pilus assembly protein TadB